MAVLGQGLVRPRCRNAPSGDNLAPEGTLSKQSRRKGALGRQSDPGGLSVAPLGTSVFHGVRAGSLLPVQVSTRHAYH